MSKPPLVCDTTLFLYLGRIGQERLLQNLFEPVYVPQAVNIELAMGRVLRPDTMEPEQLEWVISVPTALPDIEKLPANRLGLGERAVLAYAYMHPGCWVGLDDRQARLLAMGLGLKVVGTVGIIIRARRAGLISSARELLDWVKASGFHLGAEVYTEALRLVGERPEPET